MTHTIVSTADRPDLVPITARWRWEAFGSDTGGSFEDVLTQAREAAENPAPMPQTLVLLASGEPVGTASLTAQDLDQRPNLTPWLAGVYVVPHARRLGHATRLVAAIEQTAAAAGITTLFLYTGSAQRLYARAGWQTTETLQHDGKQVTVMRRRLDAPA